MQPSANSATASSPPPPPPPLSPRPEARSSSPKASSQRLSSPPAPRQEARGLDPSRSILPATIAFDHAANNPGGRRAADEPPPSSFYNSRASVARPMGGRPSSSGGSFTQPRPSHSGPLPGAPPQQQPQGPTPLHRGHSYTGSTSSAQPPPQHNHHRSATDSFTPSSWTPPNAQANTQPDQRAIYSVASHSQYQPSSVDNTPQINQLGSSGYTLPSPVSATSAYAPPPLNIASPPPLQTPTSSFSSPPLSPPPQTPPGVPFQTTSPPLQPGMVPGQRGVVQDVGKAVAQTVGSTMGKIAIKAVLGTVGLGVVGDLLGDVAGDALADVGAEAAASAFTGEEGGGLVDAFAGGAAFDPSAYLSGLSGGGGSDISSLVDAFSGLSTTSQPSYYDPSSAASSTDIYTQIMQNYQAQSQAIADQYANNMSSINSGQNDYGTNSFTEQMLQIAQDYQKQQQTYQQQFAQAYQTNLQNQTQATQNIMQHYQAQQQAYMKPYQDILNAQAQAYQQPPRPPQPQSSFPSTTNANNYQRPPNAQPYASHHAAPYSHGTAGYGAHPHGRR
ncbi:hypothetical protein ONZ45_g7445 [Pleurotus djamor]|nr:hypothetical protein ONZ45_g7445 [Pleurotus djamor]